MYIQHHNETVIGCDYNCYIAKEVKQLPQLKEINKPLYKLLLRMLNRRLYFPEALFTDSTAVFV